MKSEKCWAILRKSSNQFLFQPSNDSAVDGMVVDLSGGLEIQVVETLGILLIM
ncbi:MAG: hypothetical protein QXM52_07475 [Candidatus Bathyarchaeia archaeon]